MVDPHRPIVAGNVFEIALKPVQCNRLLRSLPTPVAVGGFGYKRFSKDRHDAKIWHVELLKNKLGEDGRFYERDIRKDVPRDVTTGGVGHEENGLVLNTQKILMETDNFEETLRSIQRKRRKITRR